METDRKAKHFFVPIKEIVDNNFDLSITRYRDYVFDKIVYEKPNVILKKLIGENGLEKEIIKKLEELKQLF